MEIKINTEQKKRMIMAIIRSKQDKQNENRIIAKINKRYKEENRK